MFANPCFFGKGALDGKELFTIEGSEEWRSIPNDLEERERCRISLRKAHQTPGRHEHRHTARWNNVQISSANLRVDADFHVEKRNYSKSSWTDA